MLVLSAVLGLLYAGVAKADAAPSSRPSTASLALALALALRDVGQRPPAGDHRYLYTGPATATGQLASIWDSRTDQTTRVLIPAGCDLPGFPPAVGAGLVFFTCGANPVDQTGWVYAIADRRWTRVADSVFGGFCDNAEGECTAVAAGSDWVVSDSPPAACDPLSSSDLFAALADRWVALVSADESASLFVERCGSAHRIRLATQTQGVVTAGPLLIWQPAGYDTDRLRGFNAALGRTFTLRIASGLANDGFYLGGIVRNRIYGTDLMTNANFVGTLPPVMSAR